MTNLDLRAYRCPEPLIRLKLWLRTASAGDQLLCHLADAGSRRDIPAYLTRLGHRVELRQVQADSLLLWVQICHKESH